MPEKKKILFVDDETKILEGLKRLLRPMRNEWEMAFAEGGEKALEILTSDSKDVIVSDMRMPGMNGAELLKRVKQEYPHVVRIVLSGQSSQEFVMESVGIAHQYLSKPCDPDLLKKTIDRACALHGVLQNDSLQRVVSQAKSLPSPPTIYLQIIEELQYPDAGIKRVGEIIAQDAGMSAKVLQLVNSAFFGLPRQVSNPVQAANFLGVETLKQLVLSVHVFSQIDTTKLGDFRVDDLWKHSMSTGAAAKKIAQCEDGQGELVDEAMMAGLLHDAGKLVLVSELTDQYQNVLTLARNKNIALWEAEREVLGATHAEVGAYLLGLWGLPDSIVEAVAFHHEPSKCGTSSFTPLTAVHTANALLHEETAENETAGRSQLDTDYLAGLQLVDRLPKWRDAVKEMISKEDNDVREDSLCR